MDGAQGQMENASMNELDARALPPDDALRRVLHNEVHARPSARVRLPALITYVALLSEGVSREQECAHLQRLPGHADLTLDRLQGNFLRLRWLHRQMGAPHRVHALFHRAAPARACRVGQHIA
jgi:hypothetical protein